MAQQTIRTASARPASRPLKALASALVTATIASTATPGIAQVQSNLPITPAQRNTAQAVAERGVPITDLTPNAPDVYVVKRGDTLWRISGLFLTSPWRWPELWGMNVDQVRNPHLIYPGQTLALERNGGFARLRVGGLGSNVPTDTVRISPRTRYESLADAALPTLQAHLIEPFLAEPLVVDELTVSRAPRIVAALDQRVLLAKGDRAYVRSEPGTTLATPAPSARAYRIFRSATPLKDPATGAILGYEAQYVGRADLVKGETLQAVLRDGKNVDEIVPATIDIIGAKEEMRVGDRLLPEPPRQLVSYIPRPPEQPVVEGRVVSIYGNAVAEAAQNQVVVINKGTADGMQTGHVLAILSEGKRLIDKTDPSRPQIKLPDERNGLLMVFRPFERVSYALVLDVRMGVKVGDRLVAPGN